MNRDAARSRSGATDEQAQWRTAADDGTVTGRILAVIRSFSNAHSQLTLAELVARTGIPKPTVHRMANDLVARGVLERTRHGYQLGLLLFELGQHVPSQRSLRDPALPFMEDLYEASHEIVHLGILYGHDVMYIEKIVGHRSVDVPSAVGRKLPAHASAIGKVMLAFSPPDVAETLMGRGLVARTPHTIVVPSVLRQELGTVRREGVAYDREESKVGLVCVAAPILRSDGIAIAGMSVTGPAHRMKPEYLAAAVRAAALGASRAITAHLTGPSVGTTR